MTLLYSLWRAVQTRRALFVSIILFVCTTAHARELETTRETADLRGIPITVYTYRPQGCANPALLFVFHGNGRSASSYRDSARSLADRACLIVFAPLFDENRFSPSSYHRGGIKRGGRVLPREKWTVTLVKDLVEWARKQEQRPTAPFYLFGHSAGGQFLSRVGAFLVPSEASQIVVANPSTYVLPSLDEPAPYGFGGVLSQKDGERQLKEYLRLPITIYLGLDDTGNKDLTDTEAANRQGKNRLERGRFVFNMAQALSLRNHWEFKWRIVEAASVGHSAAGMLESKAAIDALGLSDDDVRP
jgi:pimeloyl-ACP methyl ester carboxylesterase